MLNCAASSPASGNRLDWRVFSQRMIRHLPLLLLVAAFFVLEFTYPRFPDMDHETYFKAAGWNAIQKGAFAAPELEGYRHLDPPIERVYFTYPPLYTWLFGQWSRVTGFGWVACVGYDALISAVLAFIVYALAGVVADALLGPLSGSRRTALAFVPALLTLLFRQVARPDELGMALGFANLYWLLLPRASSARWSGVAFVSGALAGLTLCTSLGVFLAFMPLLAALWLLRENDVREKAHALAAWALGAGLVAALCLTPLYLTHSHFYRQFFQYSHHLQSELRDGFAPMFSHAWQVSRQSVFLLFATMPVFCIGMIDLWRTGRIRETLALFVAPLVGFGLVSVARESFTYWWFLQPWFLLVAVIVAANFWWTRRSRLMAIVVASWLAAWVAVASAWPAKNYLARMTVAPEQRLATNVQKLRMLIPSGAGVLTANSWWALGDNRAVYDPRYSDIKDLARIEYFVTGSNGTGQPSFWVPPSNPRYEVMLRESFEVISDALPRAPVQILGLRITNSAYGHGAIILRRKLTYPR
jgi:hypothetical protein